MKRVLFRQTESGTISVVNDHGTCAMFFGNPFNSIEGMVFKRAVSPQEFEHLCNDDRYTSCGTELHIPMPTKWEIMSKNGNTLLLRRKIGEKVQLANLTIKPGYYTMHHIVKDIETRLINGKSTTEKFRIWYDGKFNNTVVELLPGFSPIRDRKPVAKVISPAKKQSVKKAA